MQKLGDTGIVRLIDKQQSAAHEPECHALKNAESFLFASKEHFEVSNSPEDLVLG